MISEYGRRQKITGIPMIVSKTEKYVKFKIRDLFFISFEQDIINNLDILENIEILDIIPKRSNYVDKNGNKVWATDLIVKRIRSFETTFIKIDNKEQSVIKEEEPKKVVVSDELEQEIKDVLNDKIDWDE